jgi:PAS domain-containing protein
MYSSGMDRNNLSSEQQLLERLHKQRLAEEALREAQARFTRAMQGTQDGLWEIDPVNGRLWLSPRLSELLGFADGELGDKAGSLRARAHPDDYASMETSVVVAVESGAHIDLEVRISVVSAARYSCGEFRRGGDSHLGLDAGCHRGAQLPG